MSNQAKGGTFRSGRAKEKTTGTKLNKRFQSEDKVEKVELENRTSNSCM
jgi:translation elongation factor P/translation initiation factor 5A